MTKILDCYLTLCEPTFFASREIDRLYLTEALIGNYALVYAMGLAQSSYFMDKHRPTYEKDLSPLSQKGIYLTPAHPITPPRFRVERFNVQTETYWSAYSNCSILFDPAEGGKVKPKPYANNRPQQGMLKMLARGSSFRFFAFGLSKEQMPSYIRLGKFLSKAKLECKVEQGIVKDAEKYSLTGYYNPLDLPNDGAIEVCNVINIHPVPILQAVIYRGKVFQLPNNTCLPIGLSFGF